MKKPWFDIPKLQVVVKVKSWNTWKVLTHVNAISDSYEKISTLSGELSKLYYVD